MPDVASVAKPIKELAGKGIVFCWGKEQQTAFEKLKWLITQAETQLILRLAAECRSLLMRLQLA